MRDGLGAPQSVFVLGGTSDIGLAVVRALGDGPLRTVVLAGRRRAALEAAAADLSSAGVKEVDVVTFDADDTATHGALVDDVFDRHPDIDVVLMVHGVLGDQERAEQNPDEAVRILQTNFVGSASLGLHAARRLRQQGHGTLVVLSSVAGERARRANFVYGSSKAGLDAFFQGLGDSLVGSGVDVMIVRPGFVRTKMTEGMDVAPLSTTPEAVAEAIVHGLARGRETVWVPSTLRYVMSVLRHVPRPVFRRLPL
jgi:decaprenylphospho-beta-D-erythro-pentofuranosid-2-ulose 2-reductase